jgi:hypothetical protein
MPRALIVDDISIESKEESPSTAVLMHLPVSRDWQIISTTRYWAFLPPGAEFG